MQNENYLLDNDFVVDVDNDDTREELEMPLLTAMMCISQLSDKGKELVDTASDEVLMDMLNTYTKLKLIY